MEEINLSINNRIKLEKMKKNNNKYNYLPTNFSNKTFTTNVNHNNNIIDRANLFNNNNYRKELIIAKVIISELQDKIEEIKKDKKDLESQLNEALSTIKFLHSDYISLTDKFDKVNRTIISESNNKEKIYNEVENKINELKTKNEQLNDEILAKKEINKLQEDALNRKIILLTKKLEKTEEELDNYKQMNKDIKKLELNKKEMNNENLILREDNIKISNKYNDERKKFYKEIEEYKNKIKKLENENFMLSSELKEKNDMLQKEQNMNSQYTKLDKFFNNKNQEKNYDLINDKYTYILKEFDNYKIQNLKEKKQIMDKYDSIKSEKIKLEEEYTHKLNDLSEKLKMRDSEKDELIACNEAFDILKEEKKYILNLLLRVTPNPNLIQQIIDINKEIIQLERKKISIINNKNNNPKVNLLLPKIDEQINIFKNHLSSLEDELINVDLGSSRSNIDNSISSSVL